MQLDRDKRLWIFVLASLCIVALLIVYLLYSPVRRIRSAGADYDPRSKSGKMIRAKEGTHFDDVQLAIIVDAIDDCREPQALYLTGEKITDRGFSVFENSTNIYLLKLKGLIVTDESLKYLDRIESLKYLGIWNCENISKEAVNAFRAANPTVKIVHGVMRPPLPGRETQP